MCDVGVSHDQQSKTNLLFMYIRSMITDVMDPSVQACLPFFFYNPCMYIPQMPFTLIQQITHLLAKILDRIMHIMLHVHLVETLIKHFSQYGAQLVRVLTNNGAFLHKEVPCATKIWTHHTTCTVFTGIESAFTMLVETH